MELCWPRRHYTQTHTHNREKAILDGFLYLRFNFLHTLAEVVASCFLLTFLRAIAIDGTVCFYLDDVYVETDCPPPFHSLLDTLIALSIHAERLSLIHMTKDQTNQPRGEMKQTSFESSSRLGNCFLSAQ